jgi:hypothetical protein
VDSSGRDKGSSKLVAQVSINMPVVYPVLHVRVNIAVVNRTSYDDCVGIFDI